jgi:hypothetical protein
VLITTEAVHAAARESIEGVLNELKERIPSILGRAVSTDIIDAEHPFSEHDLQASSTPAS